MMFVSDKRKWKWLEIFLDGFKGYYYWSYCKGSLSLLHVEMNIIESFLFRSSRPEVFCKKSVLWNFAKFTGKHSFLIKLQVLGQNTSGDCFCLFIFYLFYLEPQFLSRLASDSVESTAIIEAAKTVFPPVETIQHAHDNIHNV